MSEPQASSVDALERWALFGAEWRVVSLSDERVAVELCTCTSEPVERWESGDPALISYLRQAQADRAPTTEKKETP
jgi:hypothetical protein